MHISICAYIDILYRGSSHTWLQAGLSLEVEFHLGQQGLVFRRPSRRLPRRSAADHAGWRYEHIGWIFRYMSTRVPPSGSPFPSSSPPPGPSTDSYRPGRGAEALWAAVQQFYSGGIPATVHLT